MAAGEAKDRGLGSVDNALRLLEHMSQTAEEGVSDLARSMGLSKGTIDRLLSTLGRSGYVEQDPNSRKYRLGVKVLTIAENVRGRMGLIEVTRPHLVSLAADVHEAVNLGVVRNGSLVYLDNISSDHAFRIESRPGTALPAYATGAGKAVLAFTPAEEVEIYLAETTLIRHTPATVVDIAELRAELDAIRSSGVAVDRGELLEEARCVAAPILGADGWAIAAISINAPRSRYEDREDELAVAVRQVAGQLSDRLRGTGIGRAVPLNTLR